MHHTVTDLILFTSKLPWLYFERKLCLIGENEEPVSLAINRREHYDKIVIKSYVDTVEPETCFLLIGRGRLASVCVKGMLALDWVIRRWIERKWKEN